jgi:hypothetical protein
MIKKLLFLIGFPIVSGLPLFAQEITSEEWTNYFNAIYLPEGSEQGVQSAEKIQHAALKQKAYPAQQLSLATKESYNRSKMLNSAPAAASDDFSPEAERVEFSPLAILQEVKQLEKTAGNPALKSAYSNLMNEIPWHSNVYHYAELLLKSVSPGGILLVNGEIDALPPRALQNVNSIRNDVVIVHVSWFLESETYRKSISNSLNAGLDWQNGQTGVQLINQLSEQFPGKIHLSMTLPVELLRPFISKMQPCGLTFQLTNQSTTARHHLILKQTDWSDVLENSLPGYVIALQQNYLAALLADEKSGTDPELGNYNRNMLIENLMKQTGMKSSGKKYLNGK